MKLTRRSLFGTLIAPLLAKFWPTAAVPIVDGGVVSGITSWDRALTEDEMKALASPHAVGYKT